MLFDRGHRSMVAWNFMFSICFLSMSLSIWARIVGSSLKPEWVPQRPLYTQAKNRSTPNATAYRMRRRHSRNTEGERVT